MRKWIAAIAALAAAVAPAAAMAQNSDLAPVPASEAGYGTSVAPAAGQQPAAGQPMPADTTPPADATPPASGEPGPAAEAEPVPGTCAPGPSVAAKGANGTYSQQDVLGAAERTFGKGAEGLGKTMEKIFKDNGEPTAYIAGREAGGAIIAGLRYGSGIMSHKIEGNCKVYWTGPSVGFDLGANASKVFVLVYNLYDTKDLYHRFGAVEGQVYFIGGFTFAYLRRGDIVLVPVRLGVGWRLGANVGYMKFSQKAKWMPF